MQWLRSLLGMRDDHADLFSPVPPNPAQDALAAIDDLSRAMRNHQGCGGDLFGAGQPLPHARGA